MQFEGLGAVAKGGLDKSGNFIFKPPFKPFCFHLGCEIQTKLDFFFHLLPQTICLHMNPSNPSDTFVSRLGVKKKKEIKRKAAGFLFTTLYCDHCVGEWRGTAGQLHYPPLIYSGREHRWMLPSLCH